MPIIGHKRLKIVVSLALINDADEILLSKRPKNKHLAGFWEFPGGKLEERESLQECLRREIREELDFEIEVGEVLCSVDHAYTHVSITLYALSARYKEGEPKAIGCADWRWVYPEQLDDFAFPRSDRKVIEFVRQRGWQLALF